MAVEEIYISGRNALIRRAISEPKFKREKVLTSDIWTYIALWLRRNAANTDAAFFWGQAREFYTASRGLPETASPLPLYYCFLNATKALLASKRITYQPHHGLTGSSEPGRASLSSEMVHFKGGGVLPALARYLGEVQDSPTYALKDLFYNLAFIHRAYCLSYRAGHIFFPLQHCRYVRGTGMSEAWLSATMERQYDDGRFLATLPPGFEKDIGFADELVIRKRQRFRWRQGRGRVENNLSNLARYHSKLRRDVTYIAGVGRWYIKRRLATATNIDRHSTTLIFAAMHRLSELSRYDPLRLSRLLDTQRNWLLAEFIKMAPTQFIDEIACEITGEEIDVPGIHGGNFLHGS